MSSISAPQISSPSVSELAAEYFYERVGFDGRFIEFLPDGSIGRGGGGEEKSWSAALSQGAWELSIYGDRGLTCRLIDAGNGVFRGHWAEHERMPIILTRNYFRDHIRSGQANPPARNPITGFQARSVILERLGHDDVRVCQIVFGCWRAERTLCKDGTISGNGASGETWRQEGDALILATQDGDRAKYGICDNPRELHGRWIDGDQPLSKISLPADGILAISPDKICIVIGSYEQPEWAIANARACRIFNPGCPILVVDDQSSELVANELRTAASRFGFHLLRSNQHMGHYPGDLEVLKAGFRFAHEVGASYLARCNQRSIQMRSNWAVELAAQLVSDDAAVAYQGAWGDPTYVRTEFLAFSVTRWQRLFPTLEYGKLAFQDVGGVHFERWFYQLIWELFPWQHTPISWYSRDRWGESQWTLSYYGGTSGATATEVVDRLGVAEPVTAIEEIHRRYSLALNSPSDINEHVPTLRFLASQCEQVTEFGVRSGVSTTALLAGLINRQGCRLVSYDITKSAEAGELESICGTAFRFVHGDSRESEIEPTDLLFIDTLHTAAQLWVELKRSHSKVRRWIAFHDTITFGAVGEDGGEGLMTAINRFLKEFPEWSVATQYSNNNGLLILQNNKFSCPPFRIP